MPTVRSLQLNRCTFATMMLLGLSLPEWALSTASGSGTFTADVEIVNPRKIGAGSRQADASNVALWLVPLDSAGTPSPAKPEKMPQLVQRKKAFEPHVLIVRVGTVVDFPNEDPFFHNVFSLFEGKRFDLGLYAAGTTRSVKFDRPGVSYLFCNIHSEMSAVVLAVETPYFAVSSASGSINIADVPDGRYQMHVWYERSSAEDLHRLTREVSISESQPYLWRIRIIENPSFTSEHKNKYGLDYVPSSNEGYSKR